jgi:hypothetical protein
MAHRVKRTIRFVRWIETAVANTGWFMTVKDGSQPKGDVQDINPSLYTKTYRMRLDGQFTNTWVKFVYNQRDNWADFTIMYEPDGMLSKATAREVAGRRVLVAMQNTNEATVPELHVDKVETREPTKQKRKMVVKNG